MARDAGAKKVIMASCAPPIRFVFSPSLISPRSLANPLSLLHHSYPNVYGIDMPSRFELVANGRTEEEITTAIGADLTIWQTLPDLVAACSQFNSSITEFDCSVFTGNYVTGGVDEAYLAGLESLRSDNAKIKANAQGRPPVVNVNGAGGNQGGQMENGASVVAASAPMNEVHADGGDDTSNGEFRALPFSSSPARQFEREPEGGGLSCRRSKLCCQRNDLS